MSELVQIHYDTNCYDSQTMIRHDEIQNLILTHFSDYNYKLIPWITSSKSSNQKLEFIQPWVTQCLIWSWNDQQDNWTLRSHLSWWLATFSFIRIQIIFFRIVPFITSYPCVVQCNGIEVLIEHPLFFYLQACCKISC